MNKTAAVLILLGITLVLSACQDRTTIRQPRIPFPGTVEEMERLTKQELAGLDDIRVPLGKSLDQSSLQDNSKIVLRLKRNSIFAQYGYPFTVKWIRSYFESRAWYKQGSFNPSAMTAVDTANIRLIEQQEKKIAPASPFIAVDRMSSKDVNALPDLRASLDTEIDESMLRLMNRRELKILKNSIFAQYGRTFKTPWLQKYFDSRPWYKAGSYSDAALTKIDRRNVDLIMKYETAGDHVPERQILQMGYCENDAGAEIERYVFKEGNVLQYTLESQSAYGGNDVAETHAGQWRLSAGGVQYRFGDAADWEGLEVDPATHLCR